MRKISLPSKFRQSALPLRCKHLFPKAAVSPPSPPALPHSWPCLACPHSWPCPMHFCYLVRQARWKAAERVKTETLNRFPKPNIEAHEQSGVFILCSGFKRQQTLGDRVAHTHSLMERRPQPPPSPIVEFTFACSEHNAKHGIIGSKGCVDIELRQRLISSRHANKHN